MRVRLNTGEKLGIPRLCRLCMFGSKTGEDSIYIGFAIQFLSLITAFILYMQSKWVKCRIQILPPPFLKQRYGNLHTFPNPTAYPIQERIKSSRPVQFPRSMASCNNTKSKKKLSQTNIDIDQYRKYIPDVKCVSYNYIIVCLFHSFVSTNST